MTLILSYPKSGSNFLHYSIKQITGLALNKSHAQNKEFFQQKHDKLIFIIRNYKECIPRQTKDYEFGDKFKSQLLNFRTTTDHHHFDYITTLDYYDKYKGDKTIIYYEDFILNTRKELLKIIKFLGDYDTKLIDNYINDIDFHKKCSINIYNSITHNGCTSLDKNLDSNINFHSAKIPNNTRIDIDYYIISNYKNYYDKYLCRYLEQ